MPAQLHTEWSTGTPPGQPASDLERHELFAKYAKEVADEHMPWLFPLLNACDARVLTAPGIFCFTTYAQPGVWLEVPEMMSRLQLVPWITDEDSAQ